VVAATVGEGVAVGRAVTCCCRLTGVVVLLALVGLRLALGLARVKTAGAARRVNRDWPLDTAEEMGLVWMKVDLAGEVGADMTTFCLLSAMAADVGDPDEVKLLLMGVGGGVEAAEVCPPLGAATLTASLIWSE